MRLINLNPRWWGWVENGIGAHCGITFLCPHCHATGQRLGIAFTNPISVGGFDVSKMAWPGGQAHYWNREGETFDTLTLRPSINAEIVGHWHGHIVNGEVT